MEKNLKNLLIFDKDGCDISDMVVLTKGRCNPFGWSQYKLIYLEEHIGWLESGCLDLKEGYSYEVVNENC